MDYPDLKRAVRDQQRLHRADVILIEDRASGTQLIQDLVREGVHAVRRYRPQLFKVMRLYAQTATNRIREASWQFTPPACEK